MKYVQPSGTLCVSSEKNGKFINFMTAVMACTAVQMFYASMGFSTHTDIYRESKRIEVRVHIDSYVMPALPGPYLFSHREITSFPYTSSWAKPGERVRVVTYYFEF